MLLFLMQVALVAAGRTVVHRRLGLVGLLSRPEIKERYVGFYSITVRFGPGRIRATSPGVLIALVNLRDLEELIAESVAHTSLVSRRY
jgi:hypothetical protein